MVQPQRAAAPEDAKGCEYREKQEDSCEVRASRQREGLGGFSKKARI